MPILRKDGSNNINSYQAETCISDWVLEMYLYKGLYITNFITRYSTLRAVNETVSFQYILEMITSEIIINLIV